MSAKPQMHTEDAYNYVVSCDDGSMVSVLKTTVTQPITWTTIAQAAGLLLSGDRGSSDSASTIADVTVGS